MEKTLLEDDCVDSGAETGGSDYSPLSSTSINGADFMADPQDPYLVSVHLIADPDQGGFLQNATDAALSWVHPDLQLFRVSERAHCSKKRPQIPSSQPALAVILFLQESYGGEEHILSLHRALQRPPWRYHHTENQDFFTLTPGTPLWAVRQVHYGKEIVRFTIYCRYENYIDMVRLYKLLLQKRVLRRRRISAFREAAEGAGAAGFGLGLLEVRVRDVGALVPLLPHTCSPISELRWQTQDYDGNKILLQVQMPLYKHRPDSSFPPHESASAPSTFTRHSAPYRHHHNHQHHQQRRNPNRSASFHSSRLQTSQVSLPLACDYLNPNDEWSDCRFTNNYTQEWKTNRSGSLFSLPNISSNHSPRYQNSPKKHVNGIMSSLVPPFRLNVDALIGAEETDVDTGDKVAMDLSVVSAYIQAGLSLNSRPVSAPPEEIVPSRSPSIPDVNGAYKVATIGVNRSNSLIVNGSCGSFGTLLGHGSGLSTTVSSVSINQSDSCSIDEEKVEEEEEFYI
ncbi:hypothetical protein WMY93_001793 [Mugilogobius chulae]|uniref:FAM124 domain-containing protein n=1 Tax=Mugilogobius chulae TaxID=88201 RepID=A0AAW0Q1J3_9GOBI